MVKFFQRLGTPSSWFLNPVDDRVYAIVRIAFAFVVLMNLGWLWAGRQEFFSGAGLLDQAVLIARAEPAYFSIFRFFQSETAVNFLMLATAFALIMLMLGIAARWAVFWVVVWQISYIARAPLLYSGWDTVARAFSFLLLISPLGLSWSLPALLKNRVAALPLLVPRYGLVLMRLQVTAIYWQAELNRLIHPDPYWRKGEFLSYFLLSHHARWPSFWVMDWSNVLTLGTYGIQFAELSIPVLLWIKRTRWWGFLLGVTLHMGICVLARDFAVFGFVMVMTYFAFMRSEDAVALDGWINRLCGRRMPGSAPKVSGPEPNSTN